MKNLLFLIIVFFLIFEQADAQNSLSMSMDNPETAGFSLERLTRIDDLFKEYVDKGYYAGISALVSRKGKVIYYKATGIDNIKLKTPLKKDAIFRIASQTKAITSVAAMILYEQGRFILNDPIAKYLPEFDNQKVINSFHEKDSSYTTEKVNRQVTIFDLLSHTSGFCYPGTNKEMDALFSKKGITFGFSESGTLQHEMQKLANLPLFHQPGVKFTYGYSTDVLGYLIEALSGMSLDEYFIKNIFEPLGMKDTYFYLPKSKHSRLMKLYGEDKDKQLSMLESLPELDPDFPLADRVFFSGGGGLSSTAYDYAIFMQMLLNGGEYNGTRILGKNTIAMMTTNQIGDLVAGSLFLPDGADKFGLGFEIISLPGSSKVPISEGAFGWGGAFGSLYWIDPKEQIIAQLIVQKSEGSNTADLRAKFIATVYQALVE